MRRLFWAAGLLVVIFAALLTVAAVSLNRIIARERDHVLQQARTALGRDVTADDIKLNLWRGLGVRADNVRIGEDPRFGTTDFARAARVIVRAKLLPLLRGRLEVRRIDLRQPHVQLIRDAAGQWNYATIGRASAADGHRSDTSSAGSSVSPEQLPFVIAQANIGDGTFTIIDRSRQPEGVTRVMHVDVAVSGITEYGPVSFDVAAALQDEERNVRVHGVAGPWRDGAAIPLRLDGTFGPLGPQAVLVNDLHLEAALTPAAVEVSAFTGRVFGGSFQLTGQYPLRKDGAVIVKGELSQLAVAQVLRLSTSTLSRRFDGTGHVTLDLHAAGGSVEAVRTSLAGQVTADIQNAVLRDSNLIKHLVEDLASLPKIGEEISRRLKPKYGTLLSAPDTQFHTMHATFRVSDQQLHTDDLTVEATEYGLKGSGWLGFDENVDIKGTLALAKDLTNSLLSEVKETRYLIDDRERLAVPCRMHGKIGQAQLEPDIGYLTARLSQAVASGAVKDLLQKFLGSAPSQSAPPKTAKPENSIEQRFRDLLGR